MVRTVVVIRRLPLVNTSKEWRRIFRHGFELVQHLLSRFVKLFLTDMILIGPLAPILSDLIHEIPEFDVRSFHAIALDIYTGNEMLERET